MAKPSPGIGATSATSAPLHVVAFGTYQADVHPRVRVLIEGLRDSGHDVVELNEPLGLTTADRVAMIQRPWRLLILGGRLLTSWSRLAWRARHLRRGQHVDVVLVGYLGHFDVHLARRLFPAATLAVDHLVFAAGTAQDRGATSARLQKVLGRLDRAALDAADVIILDTDEHRARVAVHSFAKTVVCPVGADESWFAAGDAAREEAGLAAGAPHGPLKVVFFGLFTPLQGTATIGKALRILADRGLTARDLHVTMLGSGQDLHEAKAATGKVDFVDWRSWVAPQDLPDLVASHDVALGIFGTTTKAAHVVPNKVYQSAAAGCAVLTSDTPPQRRVLGAAARLVPPGDASSLADVLMELVADRTELSRARIAAGDVARKHFTPRAVVGPLVDRLSR